MKSTMIVTFILACICAVAFTNSTRKPHICFHCNETTYNCGYFGHCVNGCCETKPQKKPLPCFHCTETINTCGYFGHCVKGCCETDPKVIEANRGKRQEGFPCETNRDCGDYVGYCGNDHKCHY